MSPETIQKLNALNRAFYEQTSDHFDATRQQPWPGWARLLDHLPVARPLRVLDVGCGNGRFGVWLRDALPGALAYHGVDNSPRLLAHARAALAAHPTDVTLTEADIVTGTLPDGRYDLVVLFGVLHHIPGNAERAAFVHALAERVAVGGQLSFAAWRFYDNPRFQARVQPWPPGLEREPGDYLLDWRRGTVARRYCHHVDDAEHDRLVAAAGLREVVRYRADGADNRTNQYSLLYQ